MYAVSLMVITVYCIVFSFGHKVMTHRISTNSVVVELVEYLWCGATVFAFLNLESQPHQASNL